MYHILEGTLSQIAVLDVVLVTILFILIMFIGRTLKKVRSFQGDFPIMTFQDGSELANYLKKECKSLRKLYKPPFYLRNHHLQTFFPSIQPGPNYTFKREYVLMKDGGQVALDWGVSDLKNLNKSSNVLLILPGLTGENSGFKSLCKRASKLGLRPVFYNKRGHGNSIITTPKLQSFGDATDLRTCILYIHTKYPGTQLLAVGHSAGSGVLASYLGEYMEDCRVSAAACVSPGYDAVKLFRCTVSWPYDFLLLRGLKRLIRQHADILSKVVDINDVMASNTIDEFDDRFYRKLYNFPDMDSYWSYNNPMNKVWKITIPIMCLSSVNDPVVPERLIPYDEFKKKPNFLLVTTKYGGHCGFINESHELYADELCLDYLLTAIKYTSSHDKNTNIH